MGRLKTDTWERMLEQMEQEGVGFYLNGKKTAPREIIRTCCMREKAVYMPDFIMDEEGKLCGDVDFEAIGNIASIATPVPGGVGSVTTSVLAKHLVKAAHMR